MMDDWDLKPARDLEMPAAERYRLAPLIDRWVITASLEWLADHPSILANLGLATLNLSGQTLGDDRTQLRVR